jgi:hypothetical protein
MRGNEPLRRFLPSHELGGFDRGSGLQLPTVFAWIDPLGEQSTVLCIQLAGALEMSLTEPIPIQISSLLNVPRVDHDFDVGFRTST